MTQTLDIQELAIVVAVKNHNPAILTVDFLMGSGVVPADWELARPAVLSNNAAQVMFNNGVSILAQPGSVTFSQAMSETTELAMPAMASRYVGVLPNLDYQAVGINPRRFVTFDQLDGAHQFMTETLLAPGAWQAIGTAPMQAAVNLMYTLEGRVLRLNINEARLQPPEGEAIPAVLFAANFHYELAAASGQERVRILRQRIDHWQDDLHAFHDIVDHKFLTGVAVEPELAVVLPPVLPMHASPMRVSK